MSVYVHSASPYFIVKKRLAGILMLLEKNTGNSLFYFGYDQKKVTVMLSATDIDQSGH